MNKWLALKQFVLNNLFHFSAITLEGYELYARRFFNFYNGVNNLEDFKLEHFDEWVEYLINSGVKTSSVRAHIFAVRAIYKYFKEEDSNFIDPTESVELPDVEDYVCSALDQETIFKLS